MSFFSKKHHKKFKVNGIFFYKISLYLILGVMFFNFTSADFSSTNFILENPINVIGGGESTSSSFQYISTIGQLTQGQSTSSTFAQNSGFLYFPTIASDGSGAGGGGGGYTLPAGLIYLDIDNGCKTADFNCDERVNIFDLSILLYFLERSGPEIDFYDLSKDNKVDLTDTSIVFYYWDTNF